MTRLSVTLKPDPSRTVIRPFSAQYPPAFQLQGRSRAQRIADRVKALSDAEVRDMVDKLIGPMAERHRHAEDLFLGRFDDMRVCTDASGVDHNRALLIGAYFSEEFAFEAAALFNPSIVPDPDQSDLPAGAVRFALSLRGIGEGHISSVTFRSGVWDGLDGVVIDPASATGVPAQIESMDDGTGAIRLVWPSSEDISETVLFPVAPSQKQGIEDLRLVRFIEDDGEVRMLGTYTAFNGSEARQEMLHANNNLKTCEMHPLTGAAATNKGMALFPRRVDGRYAMLGREDNENIFFLTSDDLHVWETAEKIIVPRWHWEFVQMGNCGSPIEIAEGWLVLTHGVGMVRSYCIGACLLDKADPRKVLARTTKPLLTPDIQDRGGYVPNVVYSCGGIVHDRTLLLPYGIADTHTAFASAPIDTVLAAMN